MQNENQLYKCAYKEVIMILCALPDEEYEKIPKEQKDFYFDNMNKDWDFKLDYTKDLSEQKLLKQTQAILANLFKKYLATPNEKMEIVAHERKEIEFIENKKREKYNPDDIFKNRKKVIQNEEIVELPIEIKKVTFMQKIINFIKNCFNKKQ